MRRYQDAHRLAYQSEAPVNWCPALGTVLANEEVIGGLSERGGHPVVRLPLRQWMLRITAYADRLEKDLEGLDWSESIKALQRNWIGRSTGAEVDFLRRPRSRAFGQAQRLANSRNGATSVRPAASRKCPATDVIRVYTTRPDTLFGATYMVLAPEHPFVARLTRPEQVEAVKAYCEQASRKSDLDRTDLAKEKTGVFTGSFAANPVNHVPCRFGLPTTCWPAMAPARSWRCQLTTRATMSSPVQFNLPIVPVVDPGDDARGSRASSRRQGGLPRRRCDASTPAATTALPTIEFKQRITADLADSGQGREAVNYKLRDWLFSRQHFWGEPFPILHELDAAGNRTGLMRAVPAEQLPVNLPELEKFESHGSPEPPLEQAPESWLYVTIDGRRYKRETNTMPQWAGSCWYYLRFLDPKNDKALVDPAVEKAWMPVDVYIGGAEHAVLHLLYARFWHKVLYDRGHVSTVEPFQKLVNQGMILGEVELTGYQRPRAASGSALRRSSTSDEDGKPRLKLGGEEVATLQVPFDQAAKVGRELCSSRHSPKFGLKVVPTRCRRAAATSSIPTPWCASTAPTRCGCTKCSWVRSKPPSPGAWKASTASAASSIVPGG